ncbi:MAG: hypothetical protein JWO11_3911 [Nocardioides sp.]|nr:hypothetical protein [Nocardioides sp.]
MARGYNAMADVIQATADGVNLDTIWDEQQETIQLRNEARSAIASLFAYTTDLSAEYTAQTATGDDFEEASEYGVPTSLRTPSDLVKVGFPFKFWDLAQRYTWRYLAEASAAQIATTHSAALEADNRLVFKLVMRALVNNVSPGANEDGVPIKPLWNGDGDTPPEFSGNTFAPEHSHYMTTGSATLDPSDVEMVAETVEHHGYGLRSNGDRVIVLVNPVEGKVISGFRAGDGGAAYDFIPSDDAPAFITDETIIGDRPPGDFNGLRVIGSYGDSWIVQHDFVPRGYVLSVATGGPNSDRNPIAFREHKRRELKGLKQIPGGGTYPLIDSYMVRGAGCGVAKRGAAAVMQVTASATYTAPTI